MLENSDLHARDALMSRLKSNLLKKAKIMPTDVGKIFVINKAKTAGEVMTREEFLALPVTEIGEWDPISEFDVTGRS